MKATDFMATLGSSMRKRVQEALGKPIDPDTDPILLTRGRKVSAEGTGISRKEGQKAIVGLASTDFKGIRPIKNS